jgi:iron complex transport system substrate-binding protein
MMRALALLLALAPSTIGTPHRAPRTPHPPSPAASARQAPAPRTAHEAQRTGVPPRRIISLVPSVTEILFAIGAGDQVVAVSSYDHYPPAVESRPKVGALMDPDFERMISLKPDLVIVYGTQNDLVRRLEQVHVPMFHYEHAGIANITATLAEIGERVGRVAEARREVDRIQRAFDDVRRAVAGRPRPRAAIVIGRELGTLRGIFASGGIGFMHDMLEIAGATDVFADVTRQSLQATTEVLLARAPDVIIETYSSAGWTPARIAKERAVWQGLPTLPAVRTNRVYILTDEVLLVPGPRVADAVRLLAKTLHPDAVK